MTTSYTTRTVPTTNWTGRPSTFTQILYDSLNVYNADIPYDGVLAGTVWNTRIIP